MVVAVLQFGLKMASKTVTQSRIGAPRVLVPPLFFSRPAAHLPQELLVPAHRSKEPNGDLVLGFEIISENVGVANVKHFKARDKDLRPKLPPTPSVAEVGAEGELVVIADAFAKKQR